MPKSHERAPERRSAARHLPALVGWLALAAPVPPAFGGEKVDLAANDELTETETVVVREAGPPPDTGVRDGSAFATVLTHEQFAGTGADLGEILERTVGVQVRNFGGLGDLSTISIRGSTAEQVEIFLDGIPLNRALGGGVDLSTLPLGNVERVEVYRGTAPAGLALSNIGGAVELTTSPTYGGDESSVSLGAGSFGTLDVAGSLRRAIGPVSVLTSGGYARSEGDFEFLDDNGTPKNTTDDRTVARRNNDFQSVSFLGKGDTDLPWDLSAALADDFFWKDEGVPGIGSNQSDSARLATIRNLTHVQLRGHGWQGGALDAEQRFEVGYQSEAFQDLKGRDRHRRAGHRQRHPRLRVGVAVDVSPHGALDPHRRRRPAARGVPPLGRAPRPRGRPDQHPRRAFNAVLESEARFLDRRLVIDPALRFAYVDDERRPFGPFVTGGPEHQVDRRVTWKVGGRGYLTEWLEARGNVSTAFRAPSFLELFGDRGSIVGNPKLDPERGFSWDLGLAVTPEDGELVRAVRLEAIYFYADVDDRILFIQNSQRTAVAENIARSRNQGVELTAAAAFPAGFRATANATFQRTEDLSPSPSRHGNDLPGQPRTDVVGRVEWREAPVTLFTEVEYLGKNFLDPANLQEVSDRFLVAAGFKLRVTDELGLTFEARNLADDRVSDVIGYPLPGRSFFGSIEWRAEHEDDERGAAASAPPLAPPASAGGDP
ncbi:MAG: TonB-dependent receptor [Deltaproteobacteria bacterium]|nr:TonB-dependent receptor [Deltaproteobacteria bacterium]